MPSVLRLEPMRLATGNVIRMAAGDLIPESQVVVANGAGQKMVRAVIRGEKQVLSVTQRLWRLSGAAAAAGDAPPPAEPRVGRAAAGKKRKGRRGRAEEDANKENGDTNGVADSSSSKPLRLLHGMCGSGEVLSRSLDK